MKQKLFLSTLLLAGLMLPSSVFAGNLTVSLGHPKTPTDQKIIKLTFVALEVGGSDNITVRCYKKSPNDGDYVKFDDDKILIPGGNTDYCNIDSNILNASGTYSFKVTANDTIESNISTIDFDNNNSSSPSGQPFESVTPTVLSAQSTKLKDLQWLSIPLVLISAFFFLKSLKHT